MEGAESFTIALALDWSGRTAQLIVYLMVTKTAHLPRYSAMFLSIFLVSRER